jgi:hypothetical protein
MSYNDSQTRQKWTLNNLPPPGDPDAGKFFWGLFEASMHEKDRLGLPDRWFENHRLYRGDHWNKNRLAPQSQDLTSVNLIFSNIQRTVANLTSRNPIAEVQSTDGIEDGADLLLSQKIKNWWNEEEQGKSLTRTCLNMEIYGVTVEKAVPDIEHNTLKVVVVDPYAWFPAPGVFDDVNDMPYMAHAYAMPVDEVESIFGVEGVQSDDTYSLLGEDREENVPIPAGTRYGSMNSPNNFSNVKHPVMAQRDLREARALVVEMWVRDNREEPVTIQAGADPLTGEPIMAESSQPVFPGGIRKITLTNRGNLVLDDVGNPNINPALPRELQEKCYLYDRFPFSKANSYEDASTIWGFSAAEQTEDLNLKINRILSRVGDYIETVCRPPLIIPQDTGIKKTKVTNKAGLILRPVSSAVAAQIRFLQVPNLPSNFFDLLNTYLMFFDRIYAMEDVDRGETPSNIQAASAIVTLQERNAVLMRHKIRALDSLVRERGRWMISYMQNFAWKDELIKVQDGMVQYRGTDYAGREFNYLVESGSTVAKTELQKQDQALQLYDRQAIDRQALLETLNFPNWKEIIERTGENQLDQALMILIQAGLPENEAMMLREYLAQSQGGPGNAPQNGEGPAGQGAQTRPAGGNGQARPPQPGMPRANQGQIPGPKTQPGIAA